MNPNLLNQLIAVEPFSPLWATVIACACILVGTLFLTLLEDFLTGEWSWHPIVFGAVIAAAAAVCVPIATNALRRESAEKTLALVQNPDTVVLAAIATEKGTALVLATKRAKKKEVVLGQEMEVTPMPSQGVYVPPATVAILEKNGITLQGAQPQLENTQ